jgi:sigma-B regulation protein RsbU (phosphoserine phosphatase)
VLYTDGVTEAIDKDGTLFGDERLASVLAATVAGDAGAQQVVDTIVAAVGAHNSSNLQSDDLTLVVVRREP